MRDALYNKAPYEEDKRTGRGFANTKSNFYSSVNVKTKYAINKLNCLFSGKELFPDDGSIEHILPESENTVALNIGNLILLEQSINEKINNKPYNDKIPFYQQSTYPWIKQFISENAEWNEESINKRGIELAKIYYTQILGRKTPKI